MSHRPRTTIGALYRSFTPWSRKPPAGASGRLSILVVDPDGVTRRFLERAVARSTEPIVDVESVRDASSALERMQGTMFDAIIAESELPEMSGARFVSLLRREARFEHLAFIALTADRRPETKVELLHAGADDVLEKPQDATVLAAKLMTITARRRAAQGQRSLTGSTLVGTFGGLALPDVVSLFELSRRTGILAIATPRASGQIVVRDGTLWAVHYGNLAGPEAFYALLCESDGEYSFASEVTGDGPRNVDASATALIMEASRRLDESAREGGAPASRPIVGQLVRGEAAPLLPPTVPSRELARGVELELANEISLGELRLWDDGQLDEWLRRDAGPHRLFVTVFSPLHLAVAAAMSMAAPPSERWVLTALTASEKTLGVTLSARGRQSLLDVVFFDMNTAERSTMVLPRRPDIAVVHPPNGSFQLLSLERRVALDEALSVLGPTLILGVGAVELQSRLFALRAVTERTSTLHVIAAAESGRTLDVRSALQTAAAAWGALGQVGRE